MSEEGKLPHADDLEYMRQVLTEHRQELKRWRLVYLKPWPEAEAACERLLEWIENVEGGKS